MSNCGAVLLFPPNWTACVSGPHLALPLLAGASRGTTWQPQIWDLSEEFYRTCATPPKRASIVAASLAQDFDALDRLYFDWEDRFRSIGSSVEDTSTFGLLSGFSCENFRSLPLAEVARLVQKGTVYTAFYRDRVLRRLIDAQPSVVGITIASQEQMVPAIELLQLVRTALPDSLLLLGGNIVTRLRNSPAFEVLTSLSDQTIIFQGDIAFSHALQAVGESGVEGARERLPHVVSDELIPDEVWPVPRFDGIAFGVSVGVPSLSYVSTRGCYWGNCHFCAIPDGWSVNRYAGSAPPQFVADQLAQMVKETQIPRVKFVDEAMAPRKVGLIASRLCEMGVTIEWEGYARLEHSWEDIAFLKSARAGGLRKLYFGLEQAPTTNRALLGKNDRGDPMRILKACHQTGIKTHLFCMVGYPGTSLEDAEATLQFLIENEQLIDTADLVGFRLDRGTSVPGVRPLPVDDSDWAMASRFVATQPGILPFEQVNELEGSLQETLWRTVPRLLHPLYRMVGHWETTEGSAGLS